MFTSPLANWYIENTCNKGGGSCWELDQIESISAYCRKEQLPLHMDGARLFNALVARQINAKDIGPYFESISICLSKGLGAPVGSLLIGSSSFIKQARRIRKIFGGGMRQAGLIAAAGIYALDHHVERLTEDHDKAREIAKALESVAYVDSIQPVDTNIVIFRLKNDFAAEQFIKRCEQDGILLVGMGHQTIRIVTHLDIDDAKLERVLKAIKSY